MKVQIWDIVNNGTCNIDKAAERVLRMRQNDAYRVAFIIRKIIFDGCYDPSTLTISFKKDLVIPGITYEDMITISRFISKKPYNHGCEGLYKVSSKINDIMRWQMGEEDEEGGEQ